MRDLRKATRQRAGARRVDAGEVSPRRAGPALSEACFDPAQVAGYRFSVRGAVRIKEMADEVVEQVAVIGLPPGVSRVRSGRPERLCRWEACGDGVDQVTVDVRNAGRP